MSSEQRAREIVDNDPTDYDDWIECWSCGGEGFHESCFEDRCVCLVPPCYTPKCHVCQGKGGWWCDPPAQETTDVH